MSTRALRKVQKSAQPLDTVCTDDGCISDDDGPAPSTKPAMNLFQLLGDEDEEVCEDEVPSDGESKSNDMKSSPVVQKNKKKKKKKKKKGNQGCVNPETEDIDATVREVNELFGELPTSGDRFYNNESKTTKHISGSLFSVEHKHLNPDTEMKRIFGARVIQNDTMRGNRRQRNRTLHKSYWLVQRKSTWPTMSRLGLSMVLVETKNNCQYFKYEHNHDYRGVQCLFWDSVDSYNPQNIIDLLAVHPYHIDSLIQLSDICKINGDLQMASDFIERALHAFECNFHSLFNMTQGNCRLDYRIQENRALFIALFRHIAFTGQRGANRTALELCKLLLSLDPDEDPLGIILMLDYYALRSAEYDYLIRVYYDLERSKNLMQLPNFAFSVPLAMYKLSVQDESDQDEANQMLQKALMSFPGLLIPLLDHCGVVPESGIDSHQFFSLQAQINQPEALKQLVALYVGRNNPCWKEPEVLDWLMTNVKTTLARVDSGDTLVKQLEKERNSRYKGMPRNIYRHILISEIKGAMTSLPAEITEGTVLSYDPLPPLDSVVSYTRPQRRRQVDDTSGPLSMFFRSLLPNFNPQEVVEENGAVGGQPQNNLRREIGTLMDAMRDLLQNIQPAAPPVENNDNNNEEGHDDANHQDNMPLD